MFLVKFAHRIGHFWLNPDTKLYTILLGITEQTFDAIRQLFGIHYPIAQATFVVCARIFFAKPSIIHHEEFTAHRVDVCHHLVHSLLVDAEIHTLPRVEKNITLLVAMSEDILASPFMEVAACATQSFLRIGESQGWCLESCAFPEVILRVFLIDACKEIVILGIIGYSSEFIVATIFDGSTDDITHIFLSFATEREHHLTMVGMRVANAIVISDDKSPWLQFFLTQLCLVRPRA